MMLLCRVLILRLQTLVVAVGYVVLRDAILLLIQQFGSNYWDSVWPSTA